MKTKSETSHDEEIELIIALYLTSSPEMKKKILAIAERAVEADKLKQKKAKIKAVIDRASASDLDALATAINR